MLHNHYKDMSNRAIHPNLGQIETPMTKSDLEDVIENLENL